MNTSSMQKNGFTLPELVVTVGVLGILLSIALPAFAAWQSRLDAERAMKQMAALLTISRAESLNRQSEVVLCSTHDRVRCDKTATSEIFSFVDLNKNALRDAGEEILGFAAMQYSAGQLKLNPGGSASAFVFRSDTGKPRGSQGNITYCAHSGDMTLATSLIISKQGRARRSFDANGDGIEDRRSRNSPISC